MGGVHRVSAIIIMAGCVLILASCSTIRQVRPLDPGQLSATASLGGPFTDAVGWAPLPLLSLGANYGVIKNLDVELGWGITSALFGIMHADLGVNYRPWLSAGWRPGLLAGVKGIVLTDFEPGNTRVYPDLILTTFWEVRKNWYCYLGAENWIESHTVRYDGNPQKVHWLPTVHLGTALGDTKWQLQVEGAWLLPNVDATRHTTKTVGKQGMFGVFLGLSRTFTPAWPWGYGIKQRSAYE